MRTIVLSALFALAVGLTGTGPTFAAVGAPGINNAVNANTLIERTAVICRKIRVCRATPAGRVCRVERVCRRRW